MGGYHDKQHKPLKEAVPELLVARQTIFDSPVLDDKPLIDKTNFQFDKYYKTIMIGDYVIYRSEGTPAEKCIDIIIEGYLKS